MYLEIGADDRTKWASWSNTLNIRHLVPIQSIGRKKCILSCKFWIKNFKVEGWKSKWSVIPANLKAQILALKSAGALNIFTGALGVFVQKYLPSHSKLYSVLLFPNMIENVYSIKIWALKVLSLARESLHFISWDSASFICCWDYWEHARCILIFNTKSSKSSNFKSCLQEFLFSTIFIVISGLSSGYPIRNYQGLTEQFEDRT